MSFWQEQLKLAYKTQLKYNKHHAKGGAAINPDFAKQHADWVRDAQSGNYTLLEKATKESFNKHIDELNARREKRRQSTFKHI